MTNLSTFSTSKLFQLAALLIFIIAGTLTLSSCEDEIEINAPYEEVTVVVGLLDPNEDVHFVKINKLFAGEDNALALAKDRGEAEYGEEITAIVEEYDYNALSNDTVATNRSWLLTDTIVSAKDSGIFYYPEQTVYKFEARLKRPDYNNEVYPLYKLSVNRPDGTEVSSWTPVVQVPITNGVTVIDAVVTNLNGYRNSGVGFMNSTTVNPSVRFNILPPVFTKGLEMNLIFNWRDFDASNNLLADRSVEIPMGTQSVGTVAKTGNQRQDQTFRISGEAFYEAVAANTTPILSSEAVKRQPDSASIELNLWLAGEELQTFIDLNSPSQTLLEEKPAYTNIENGLGVWSSRTNLSVDLKMSQASMNELIDALELGLTGDRGFCDNEAPVGSPESCN